MTAKERLCSKFLMVSRICSLTLNTTSYLKLLNVLVHFTIIVFFASRRFYPQKHYFIILSTSRTVLPKLLQLNSKVKNLERDKGISNLSHLRNLSTPTCRASEPNDIQGIISANPVKLKLDSCAYC